MDRTRLSLNTATVKEQWSLEQCIDGCQRHGIPTIGPWRDKLHDCGVERAARLIRSAGLQVSGLCRGGMFTAPDAAGRQAALDDNRHAVDEAAALGADCLCWWLAACRWEARTSQRPAIKYLTASVPC